MRHTIETAPKDGKVVIIDDDPTGISDVAHRSAQTDEWIAENGEPSKITPTNWRAMPHDKCLSHEHDEASNSSQFEASPPRARRLIASCCIAVVLVAAVFTGLSYDFGQRSRLPGQPSQAASLEPRRHAEADQTTLRAETRQPAQAKQTVQASTQQRRRSSENKPRRDGVLDELSETQRAIEGLRSRTSEETEPLKQADAASTAQLLEQERQKLAALAQEAAAARRD